MSKNTENRNGVINPFSEVFIDTWNLWKQFRKEEHNFSYKGVISEQMALKRLVEVSEGYEDKAVRIIEQSISRGWMDFYKLKQPSNNGESSKKQAKPNSNTAEGKQQWRNAVNDEFNRRYTSKGQQDDESYLKAV